MKQLGAEIECFGGCSHCLERLHDRDCCLLVIYTDGGVDDTVALIEASRDVLPPPSVLVLVPHDDIATAVRAMKAGATDCLEKPVDEGRLLATMENLLGRRQWSDPLLRATLSRTEIAVLYALMEGKTNRQIAVALRCSPRTVEVHRRKIMRKLGAENVVDLVRRAAALGLLGRRRSPHRSHGPGKDL
jgi:FixJ family two-component response regulator